jgi:hypothetical protein
LWILWGQLKNDIVFIAPVDQEALNSHLEGAQGRVIFHFSSYLIANEGTWYLSAQQFPRQGPGQFVLCGSKAELGSSNGVHGVAVLQYSSEL